MPIRIVVQGLLVLAALVAHDAQAQANDDWASRTIVPALPFSAPIASPNAAGNAVTDPDPLCRRPPNVVQGTLWYGYTTGPTPEYVNASVGGANFYGFLAVYAGTPGAFRLVAGGCGPHGQFLNQNPRFAGIRLAPNTAYSFLVARQFDVFLNDTVTFNVSAAQLLNVTKSTDTRDGACDADCSLREAIDAVNGSGGGAILVPPGTYILARTGTNEDGNDAGDLDLRASMGIYGAGSAQTRIDAAEIDRVFDVAPLAVSQPESFALADLAIVNGRPSGDFFPDYYGGGVRAFRSDNFLGLERVLVSNNTVSVPGGSGGGGMFNMPTLIRDSVFAGNFANTRGGGIYFLGNPDDRFEMVGSTIRGNSSFEGGGMYTQALLSVDSSTITQNAASTFGGGLYQSSGRFTIASSTIVDNTAQALGVPNAGGGIRIDNNANGNVLRNSIVARNTVREGADPGPDCAGNPSVTRNYNLVQAGTCGTAGTGDVTGTPAGLAAAPQDNGGATPTYALLLASAAFDAGDPAGCTDAAGRTLATDQRGTGFPRVVNGRCDIGALESPTLFPPGAPVLDPASDSGASNSDAITNDATPRYTGTCIAGSTVAVRVDGAPVAPSVSCSGGSYDWTAGSAIADGERSIAAVTTGPGGPSLASPAALVRIDTQGPAAPVITGPATAPTATFTVTGTIAEAAGIVVLEGVVQACAAATVAAGPWDCEATFVTTGAHVLRAYAFDNAGNTGPVGTNFSVTLSETLFANGFE